MAFLLFDGLQGMDCHGSPQQLVAGVVRSVQQREPVGRSASARAEFKWRAQWTLARMPRACESRLSAPSSTRLSCKVAASSRCLGRDLGEGPEIRIRAHIGGARHRVQEFYRPWPSKVDSFGVNCVGSAPGCKAAPDLPRSGN